LRACQGLFLETTTTGTVDILLTLFGYLPRDVRESFFFVRLPTCSRACTSRSMATMDPIGLPLQCLASRKRPEILLQPLSMSSGSNEKATTGGRAQVYTPVSSLLLHLAAASLYIFQSAFLFFLFATASHPPQLSLHRSLSAPRDATPLFNNPTVPPKSPRMVSQSPNPLTLKIPLPTWELN